MITLMIFVAIGVGFGGLWGSNRLFYGCLLALAALACIRILP